MTDKSKGRKVWKIILKILREQGGEDAPSNAAYIPCIPQRASGWHWISTLLPMRDLTSERLDISWRNCDSSKSEAEADFSLRITARGKIHIRAGKKKTWGGKSGWSSYGLTQSPILSPPSLLSVLLGGY